MIENTAGHLSSALPGQMNPILLARKLLVIFVQLHFDVLSIWISQNLAKIQKRESMGGVTTQFLQIVATGSEIGITFIEIFGTWQD